MYATVQGALELFAGMALVLVLAIYRVSLPVSGESGLSHWIGVSLAVIEL